MLNADWHKAVLKRQLSKAEGHTKGQQQWANTKEQQSPINGKPEKAKRADLGITGRAKPALILRQLLSVYSRLQTLLMIASVACPITQHNVIVLHQQQHHLRGLSTMLSSIVQPAKHTAVRCMEYCQRPKKGPAPISFSQCSRNSDIAQQSVEDHSTKTGKYKLRNCAGLLS